MSEEVDCGIYAARYIHDEFKTGLSYKIDGSRVNTLQDYFDICSDTFNFPIKNEPYWDQYLDWMRDFTWLGEENYGAPITVFITGYSEMLFNNYIDKQEIVDTFFDTVFPFWDSAVTQVTGGYDKPRSFKVYIMSGDGTKAGEGPALNPIEYRLSPENSKKSEFKKTWFCCGDNIFPLEVEEVIQTMSPGEIKTVSISLRGALPDDMLIELPLDDAQANELKNKQNALLVTPAGSVVASILSNEGNTAVLDLSKGLSSIPLELRKPLEETGWTYDGDD